MRHRIRGGLTSDDGYTLTEMLVVIAIIGLIAAVLTPSLLNQMGRARVKTASLQLETIAAGVELFRTDTGRYPTKQEGLAALVLEPANVEGWTGPYLRTAKTLNDPWGQPVLYEVAAEDQSFSVQSYGADKRAGGAGIARDLTAPATK
jgi:general secretion pathway protein G